MTASHLNFLIKYILHYINQSNFSKHWLLFLFMLVLLEPFESIIDWLEALFNIFSSLKLISWKKFFIFHLFEWAKVIIFWLYYINSFEFNQFYPINFVADCIFTKVGFVNIIFFWIIYHFVKDMSLNLTFHFARLIILLLKLRTHLLFSWFWASSCL